MTQGFKYAPDEIYRLSEAARIIQRNFRKRFYRFHRLRLIERLALETTFWRIGTRLMVFCALMGLTLFLVQAPYQYSNELILHNNLDIALGLSNLQASSYSPETASTTLANVVSAANLLLANQTKSFAFYALSPPLLVMQEYSFVCDATILAAVGDGECPTYCSVPSGSSCAVVSSTESSGIAVTVNGVSGLGYVLWNASSLPSFSTFTISDSKIFIPLFSPAFGNTAAMLEIDIDSNYIVTWSLDFLAQIEDTSSWAALASFAFILVILEMVWEALSVDLQVRKGPARVLLNLISYSFDLGLLIVMQIFLCWHIAVFYNANEVASAKLVSVASSQWQGSSVEIQSGFAAVSGFVSIVGTQETVFNFGVICLYFLLIRLIQTFSFHPRIAAFLETFTRSGAEILHFLGTAVALFFILGVIGHQALARYQWSCRSYGHTLWVQWSQQASLNLPFNSWGSTNGSTFYFLLLTLIMCLCLTNFFLAVIMNTYVLVKGKLIAQITEQSFPQDLVSWFISQRVYQRYDLPSRKFLISRLKKMRLLTVVTLSHLQQLFGSHRKCMRFCQLYRSFPALNPSVDGYSPEERVDREWNKLLQALEIALVNGEIEAERVRKQQAQVSTLLADIEKQVGVISNEAPSSISKRTFVARSTSLKSRDSIMKEYVLHRIIKKKVGELVKAKGIRDYLKQGIRKESRSVVSRMKLLTRRSSIVDSMGSLKAASRH